MKKKFLNAITTLILISPTAAQSVKTIKVGVSPVMSTAGIFIAQEKSYFEAEGLKVELLTFDSSGAAMTPLLGKGELDVGAGNISTGLLNAMAEGLAIKLVADKGHSPANEGYMALIIRNDHIKSGRFKSLKDLKGFKVGFTSLGGVSQQILFEKFLFQANLKTTDVEYLKLSYPEMNVALEKKELDATIQLEPFISQALNRGLAQKFAEASAVYPLQQSGALIYSADFAKNEKSAVAFMTAYLKGVRDYNKVFTVKNSADQKEIISILDKHLKINSPEIWKKIGPVGLNPNGYLNTELLKNDIRWYLDKKYIKKTPAIDQMIDHSFVEKALKIIGQSN